MGIQSAVIDLRHDNISGVGSPAFSSHPSASHAATMHTRACLPVRPLAPWYCLKSTHLQPQGHGHILYHHIILFKHLDQLCRQRDEQADEERSSQAGRPAIRFERLRPVAEPLFHSMSYRLPGDKGRGSECWSV